MEYLWKIVGYFIGYIYILIYIHIYIYLFIIYIHGIFQGHFSCNFQQVQFFQEGLQVALLPSEREGRPWSGSDVNMDVDFVALVGRDVASSCW